MVTLRELVTSRPIVVFCVLAVVVVVIGSISISIWQTTTENVINDVASFNEDLRLSLVSEIENIGNFTYPKTNLYSIRLANSIDYYLTNNDTDFTQIQTEIAPLLFEAYSMIPQVSQVSYISRDGLLFSYMAISNTSTVAVFANSSSGGDYTWYTQTVDQITGHVNGKAKKSQPLDVTHTDWFQAAQRDYTTAFVGKGLRGEDNETLLQNVVSLYSKKGYVLLGFPIKTLTDVLNRLNLLDGELYLWTKHGTVLFREGSLHHTSFFISSGWICFGKESASVKSQCIPENCSSSGYKAEIEGSEFKAYCSVIHVSGVPLRYTLVFPNEGGATRIKHNAKEAMYLHIAVTMFLGFGWPIGFVWFMLQATRKEMHMRATLISQMEATQQAERKSLNKSQAFARASHDIRGALAGITGLIDLCRDEVKPGSDLDTSFKQVNVCTKDLNALLNSVLDMSKIESGKMQLEEEEFNLASLLEDVIDFYHPVAMKKGIDVVLDLHDDSIFKFSNVRGDSGKLKQILNNLVSNAVKFTVDGHISIRAWAKRPGPKSSVFLASEPQGRISKLLKRMLCKSKDQSSMYETEPLNPIRNNANTMDFVFEVDDTGKGIPMEMHKSVLENYVQVRETAQGQQGTGLGLGIVQSLVRLMRGEIRITEKAMGEKGTCFQFNVLLTTLESSGSDLKVRQDIEAEGVCISTPNLGLTINTSLGGSKNIRKLSPKFNNCLSSSPKQESSRVVLLLENEERTRVTERYIKNLGIEVTVVETWEHLSHDLKRLFGFSPQSSMGRAEFSFRNELSRSSCPSSRDLPLIGINGIDSRSQTPKRRSNSFFSVVLLVIDAKAGPYSELYNIVEQFRRGLQHDIYCKVVWLNKSSTHGSERGDISCSKPLHGSRLIQVLMMLPEFGGTEPTETPPELQQKHSPVAETSSKHTEIEEEELSSRFNKRIGKTIMASSSSETETVRIRRKPIENPEDEQGTSKPGNDEVLRGKRVLVVDDNLITSSIAARKLKKMGVSEVKQCDSGKEVVRLVNEGLTQRDRLPFDYIFMDCQMPEMDGYEATRQIRKVERKYGVHIPIIAVSGHDPGSKEARETIEAGMDAFLEKDMNQDHLAIIIRDIKSKMTLQGSL